MGHARTFVLAVFALVPLLRPGGQALVIASEYVEVVVERR